MAIAAFSWSWNFETVLVCLEVHLLLKFQSMESPAQSFRFSFDLPFNRWKWYETNVYEEAEDWVNNPSDISSRE